MFEKMALCKKNSEFKKCVLSKIGDSLNNLLLCSLLFGVLSWRVKSQAAGSVPIMGTLFWLLELQSLQRSLKYCRKCSVKGVALLTI